MSDMDFAPASLFFFQLSITYNIWQDMLPVTLTTKKMEEKLLLAVSVNHELNLTETIKSVTEKSRFVWTLNVGLLLAVWSAFC